jgi:hypothetical protein
MLLLTNFLVIGPLLILCNDIVVTVTLSHNPPCSFVISLYSYTPPLIPITDSIYSTTILVAMVFSDTDDADIQLWEALEKSLEHYSSRPDSPKKSYVEQFFLSSNPRTLAQSKDSAMYWFNKQGQKFTMTFPALLFPGGRSVKMGPYFSLNTNAEVS